MNTPSNIKPKNLKERLERQVSALANHTCSFKSHEQNPWSSVTFTGTRHELVLDFTGEEAVLEGERFIDELPHHEFNIPGQLVADASVRDVDHRTGQSERIILTCVLLLLEDV